ncbi:OPT oligopeptide transporter protein-domain-containing protein [Sphaerosporella brunnea]|uniref:OPT oligopeptide transporter protein-domain-containing protein n=1 Tax=Sphaerosporella brunnea TaxID=1250544 RepID=A0A5J5FAQ2_9PEZI|nr:OPT oligopeptide transporter protein-domain-containing protein [Sphaerosporella brunnea]
MYFGLQTGWVSMMSMPSSLIGFAIFKSLAHKLRLPFTPVENVLVQTVAVAVGSMPLSAGFVGVIPALERLLEPSEGGPIFVSTPKLIFWGLGVAFFGVFFAVPLRKQVIIREKLKFPSGTATALMISVLHGQEDKSGNTESAAQGPSHSTTLLTDAENDGAQDKSDWKKKTRVLFYSFVVSGIYTLISYFFPIIRNLPIFGLPAASQWLWTLNPSPAYIGQGIVMGPETTGHMLLGAVIGWGVLSPLAKSKGWAPGPAKNWATGSRGWLVWVSLAVMLADSVISLSGIVLEPFIRAVFSKGGLRRRRGGYEPLTAEEDEHGGEPETSGRFSGLRRRFKAGVHQEDDTPEKDADPSFLVPPVVVLWGLVASGILCIVAIRVVFGQVPLYATVVAFLLALILSVMGVRALGQTDLNPVSGISKLTQLIFALIVPASNPAAVVINLVAGAVSEAGAQQAGDIMQDLKTGHLIGAAPRAQFYGQLIGSVFGAIISALVYRLYSVVYPIPGELLQVPTAYVWIDCSRLVYGEGLPNGSWWFSMGFAAIFAVSTMLRGWILKGTAVTPWIPGGIAFAVGMYNTPSFTLARAIGGAMQWSWNRRFGSDGQTMLVVLASGLILGEGLLSIVNLLMASLGVPHL